MAVGKGPSGGPNVDELVDFTYRKEALGQIDPVQLLADDSVFLFSGEGDTVVDRKVCK